jgi:amphi-Trp domain-containing protein
MGKEKRLFKSEERKSSTEVSEFLHQLADKVAGGEVVLRQGQGEVVLRLPHQLVLEVEAEKEEKGYKGIRYKLEIELEWYEEEQQGGSLELG